MRGAFGTLPDGTGVDRLTLSDGALTAQVLTYGAILNAVTLEGRPGSLTLGAPDLAPYLRGMDFFGPICGPIVNRVTDARVRVGGEAWSLPDPEGLGYSLHSGAEGLHRRIWTVADQTANRVTLTLDLPHGATGLPGDRKITAEFAVTDTCLSLRLQATTDRPTLMNLANHSYWNFGPGADLAGHQLQVMGGNEVLESSDRLLPTGRLLPVAGQHLDHRQMAPFAPSAGRRYDTSYCLARDPGPERPVARVEGHGLRMEMSSTEPCLQVYDAGTVDAGQDVGWGGQPYRPFCGLALEAQRWPDAPSHATFPSIQVTPDAPYHQITRWRFAPL